MGYGIDINTIEVDIGCDCPIIQGQNGGLTDIVPGELLMEADTIWVSGDFPEFIHHSPTAWRAANIFAVENLYEGKSINDTYVTGDMVRARVCLPGSLVLAWVTSPGGVWSLSRGDLLISNGDGTLTDKTLSSQAPIAILYNFDDAELTTVFIRRAIVRTF